MWDVWVWVGVVVDVWRRLPKAGGVSGSVGGGE